MNRDIIFVTHHLGGLGGVQRVVDQLAESFATDGNRVTVFGCGVQAGESYQKTSKNYEEVLLYSQDIFFQKPWIFFQEKFINKKLEKNFENIYASKDGVIQKIDVSNVNILVNLNQYVKKGDLLVSNTITSTSEVDKIIEPFDKRFETEIKKTKIRIGFQNYYKVPNLIMKKENTWIFFHNMEGDSKKDGRREVKDMYLELTGFYNEEEDDFSFNFSCRFLYFFDADDEEYKVREKKLKEELKEEKIEHSKVITTEEGIDYGCYIFHDKSTKKGRLESILIKILRESEKNLFSKAEKFIAENKFDSERTKEYCNKKNKYKGHCKFNEEKSKISINNFDDFNFAWKKCGT